ncbi:MAG: hypothetical protein KKE23_01115 [Nanoarchaeota archaeon]|nr:hypothetical protein [Nanoarchaeota archaeon]
MQEHDRPNKIYGKTYTKRDEALENLTKIARGAVLIMAAGFVAMSVYATSEANKKFNVLKEDFKAASIVNDPKVLENILNERNKIAKKHMCVPPYLVWIENYDGSFYFKDPIVCFKP